MRSEVSNLLCCLQLLFSSLDSEICRQIGNFVEKYNIQIDNWMKAYNEKFSSNKSGSCTSHILADLINNGSAFVGDIRRVISYLNDSSFY